MHFFRKQFDKRIKPILYENIFYINMLFLSVNKKLQSYFATSKQFTG